MNKLNTLSVIDLWLTENVDLKKRLKIADHDLLKCSILVFTQISVDSPIHTVASAFYLTVDEVNNEIHVRWTSEMDTHHFETRNTTDPQLLEWLEEQLTKWALD